MDEWAGANCKKCDNQMRPGQTGLCDDCLDAQDLNPGEKPFNPWFLAMGAVFVIGLIGVLLK